MHAVGEEIHQQGELRRRPATGRDPHELAAQPARGLTQRRRREPGRGLPVEGAQHRRPVVAVRALGQVVHRRRRQRRLDQAGGDQPSGDVRLQARDVVDATVVDGRLDTGAEWAWPPAGNRPSASSRSASGASEGGRPSEEEVALGHREHARRVRPRTNSPSIVTAKVSASTRTSGRASFSGMSALVRLRQSPTGPGVAAVRVGRRGRWSRAPAGPRTPRSTSPPPAGAAPNIGRGSTGWGVGMEALASPIWAQAMKPPLMTRWGVPRRRQGPRAQGRRACRPPPSRPRRRGRGRWPDRS